MPNISHVRRHSLVNSGAQIEKNTTGILTHPKSTGMQYFGLSAICWQVITSSTERNERMAVTLEPGDCADI